MARTTTSPELMEAVHRYEGTVNQVMGDGIMALFGAPLAHKDHAVRAGYAALRLQELVAQYAEGVFRSQGVPVQIRVGLTRMVVAVKFTTWTRDGVPRHPSFDGVCEGLAPILVRLSGQCMPLC